MADVYDLRKSAEKLGKTPTPPMVEPEPPSYSSLAEFTEMYGPLPSAFASVDSNELGVVHEVGEELVHDPEPPEMEMEME